MSVNTQVSGTKQLNIQPSKNLGTVINTEVSGNYREGVHQYKKITDVQPTQVSGERHNTNYMGINDEGMNIRDAKKITGNELNVVTYPTAQKAKATFISEANEEIARQEADKKSKGFPDLVSIEITHAPTKVQYVEGQDFNTAGMVVVANYDTGASKVITDYTVTGGTALELGTTEVTISYSQGTVIKSATQAITVIAKALVSIAVTTEPTKVTYTEGEIFDPTGMVVIAAYNDESEATVTEYTYTPTTALTTEDTEVTITYEGKTTTQAITVNEIEQFSIITPNVSFTGSDSQQGVLNAVERTVLTGGSGSFSVSVNSVAYADSASEEHVNVDPSVLVDNLTIDSDRVLHGTIATGLTGTKHLQVSYTVTDTVTQDDATESYIGEVTFPEVQL